MVKFEVRFVFNIDFKKTQSYNEFPVNFLTKIKCLQKDVKMYIILGCDDVASSLVRNLSKSGEEIFVIDND